MTDFINTTPEGSSAQVGIGDAVLAHAADLIVFCKGWHKFSPFVGACVSDFLGDEVSDSFLEGIISEALENDGSSARARVHEGVINIDRHD